MQRLHLVSPGSEGSDPVILENIRQANEDLVCKKCGKSFSASDVADGQYGEISRMCLSCFQVQQAADRALAIKNDYERHVRALPAKYQKQDPDRASVNESRKYTGGSVYFTGESGSGKTYMAILIAKQIWITGGQAMFVSYPDLVFELQTNYDESWTKVDRLKSFKGTLILDDFGADKLTDFVRLVSYLIINHRESNLLPTIITSNYSLQDIDEQIDGRISSRINGMCQVVKYTGDKRAMVK